MKRLSTVLIVLLLVLSASVVLALAQDSSKNKKSMNDFQIGDRVWINQGDNYEKDMIDGLFKKECFQSNSECLYEAIILEKRILMRNSKGKLIYEYEYRVGVLGFSSWHLLSVKQVALKQSEEANWTAEGIPSQNVLLYNM